MPDIGTCANDPLLFTATTTSGTGETTVLTWPVMQDTLFQQGLVWDAWGGTVTSGATNVGVREWNTAGTSATDVSVSDQLTTAANAAWYSAAWTNTDHIVTHWTPTAHRAVPQHARTPEEIAADAARRELQRQERVRRSAKQTRFKNAAEVRARNLLMSMLTEEQRAELEENNRFHLTVHDRDGSHRVYRIEKGFQGNVKLLGPDGKPTKRYCIHSDSRLPHEDQMLAQKLLLESNEKDFLRIANMSRIDRRYAA